MIWSVLITFSFRYRSHTKIVRCLRFHVFLSQSEFGKLARENFKKIVAQRQTEFLSFWVFFLSYFAQLLSFVCLLSEKRKKISVKYRFRSRNDSKVSLLDKMAKLPIINIQLIYFYFILASTKKSASGLKRGEFSGPFFNNEAVYISEIGQKERELI